MTYIVCKSAQYLAALALLVAISPAAHSQTPRPARVGGHPNLNGVWQALNTAEWNLEAHSASAIPSWWPLGALGATPAGPSVVEGGTLPYLPDGRAKRDANQAAYPDADPVTKCYMPGIPRANYMPFPFEIIQGDSDILFAYSFASANRPVHMDARSQLSADQVPVDQWMGWSNGHWEGNTLVIEVVANDDRTWLDRAGNHHSNQMKVTERLTLIDEHLMEYRATIDDPVTYSRPWTISMPLYRHAERNAELMDYKCVEFSESLLYGKFMKQAITKQ